MDKSRICRKEKDVAQKRIASTASPGLSTEEIRLLSAFRTLNAVGQTAAVATVEGIAKKPAFRQGVLVKDGVIYIEF